MIRESFWLIVTTEEWTMRKTTKSLGEKIVKVEFSKKLNRNVLLCSNPDRKTELDDYLRELSA